MARRLLRLPTQRGQVLHAAAQADGRCHQGREAGMGRGQVLHAAAQADGHSHQGTEAGMWRGPLPPEGSPGPDQWAALARALEPRRTQPHLFPQPEAERAGGLGEQARIHHFPLHRPDNHHSDDHWLNDPLIFAH